MSLRTLRWLTILAPAAFLTLAEVVRALLIEPRFPGLLAHLIGAPLVLLGILGFSLWVFRLLQRQQQQLVDQNRELEALNRQVERLARVAERERIGRELHDGVIQAIYGAGLALDDALHTLEHDHDQSAGRAKVRQVISALDGTIGRIRGYMLNPDDPAG